MDQKAIRKALSRVCSAAVAAVLTGCAGLPQTDDKLPRIDLQQALSQARSAQEAGDVAKAGSLLEQAARAHPGAKEPWLQQAQMHLEARRYGQAIVAAQEVLQRDVSDVTAHSIMAVAGLRASAVALGHLRQGNAVQGSTREEAQTLTQTIREAIGEPVIVAPEPVETTPAARPAGPIRRREAHPAAASVRPARTSESSVVKPAATTGSRNPFSALQ